MSDPQYDTEFWFNATLYTAYEWHGDFDTEEDTREAFDAWLNSIRAEAWDEAHSDGCEYVIDAKCRQFHRNPYREGAE